MVITTPPKADIAATFARMIGERAGIVYPGAQMHTPTNVTEAALTAVSSVQADGILAIGGGSAIGLSKAIALRTDLPQIVIPTTFAGSEMTADPRRDRARREADADEPEKILPETVIYDPDLLLELPLTVAGPSAMNAMAHAVEALYVAQRQSGDVADGRGGDPGAGRRAAALPGRCRRPRGVERCALWRLARQHLAPARSASRCITRSATRWAAPSISTMPMCIA